MTDCKNSECDNCTCGRSTSTLVDRFHANANSAPVARPERITRRDPVEAAKRLAIRFEESLKILA